MKMKMVSQAYANAILDVPVFTSELKLLKGPIADQDMNEEDEDIEEGSSESVSSFGDG